MKGQQDRYERHNPRDYEELFEVYTHYIVEGARVGPSRDLLAMLGILSSQSNTYSEGCYPPRRLL